MIGVKLSKQEYDRILQSIKVKYTVKELKEKECWAKHPTHPNYLISSRGRIIGKRKSIMNPYLNGHYLETKFDGKKCFIHRAVYETFFGKIPEGYIIHHINKNKIDNNALNLKIMEKRNHIKMHNTKNKLYRCN